MSNRKRIEGLMAQAAYEELAPNDRAELDRALEQSEGLRVESAALARMADAIPVEAVEMDRDLTSSVLARVHNAPPPRPFWTARWVPAAAALVVVLSGVLSMIWLRSPIAGAPGVAKAPTEVAPNNHVLNVALAEARELIEAREYAKAYVSLSESLENGVGTSADARQLMADLAYDDLQWYPEAYENYNVLRMEFGEAFQANGLNVKRLNVLDEARGRNDEYASLYALDAARHSESFEELEGVLARYPATYVASLASAEMAELAESALDDDAERGRLAALAAALSRSTDPVARAQLKVEMGHVYRAELNDPTRARDLYREVAESDVTQLAALARASLAALEAPQP